MTISTKRVALIAAIFVVAVDTPVAGQGFRTPPSAAECERWEIELQRGGESALRAVTYGWIPGCAGQTAPRAYAAAIRDARHVQDTAYLGRLASDAYNVRDPAVFAAALEVAADTRASVPARIMGLLVAGGHVGGSPEISGWTRPELFTVTLPREGLCGFAVYTGFQTIDNGLPRDAARRFARVVDDLLYGSGQGVREQLRNFARCARSAVHQVPPQVDLSKVRVDYVCGDRFRVQNHTGVSLRLDIEHVGETQAQPFPPVRAPAIGGWTAFTATRDGTLRVRYDGQLVATVHNEQKPCAHSR